MGIWSEFILRSRKVLNVSHVRCNVASDSDFETYIMLLKIFQKLKNTSGAITFKYVSCPLCFFLDKLELTNIPEINKDNM